MPLKTPTFPWLSLIAVFAVYSPSCRSRQQQANNDEFAIKNSVEFDDSSGADNSSINGGAKIDEKSIKIQQPSKADAWHTRKLIMTFPQPDPQRIMECKEAAESATGHADNLRELNEATTAISAKISANTATYHWCFYQLMADLDIRLERDSPLLKEKADSFLSRMRTLWVIAKGLDEVRHTSSYNSYLRARYVEISQHVFGRNVENIDEDSLMVTAGKAGKTAAAFEEP